MASAYLAAYSNAAFCANHASSTSAVQHAAVVPAKRPPTVADSIQMTRLGDPNYSVGGTSKGITAKFSPDGKHFVAVLKKGNLEANTNEYSLAEFQSAEAFQSPAPRVLAALSSSSNRPAINNVRWLDDNDTILFLGEHPGEQTQLYSLKCSTSELKRLTDSASYLTSFAVTADGKEIAYVVKVPAATFLTESAARTGIAVTSEALTDLVRGSHGGDESGDDSLFIKRVGESTETKIALKGRLYYDDQIFLSPDGKHLLVRTETDAANVAGAWKEYQDQTVKMSRRPLLDQGHTYVFQYELADTVTGASQVLLDAPIPLITGSEVAWAPDSKSVVVSGVYLPLNVADPAELVLRKLQVFLVEFKVPSRESVKISQEDLRLLGWDPQTGVVSCEVGRGDSQLGKTTPKAYFRKSGETWAKAAAPEQTGKPPLPEIVLDEDMNTPPHMVAIDPGTGRKVLLMDLNPQIQNLALARVEEITWKAHGVEIKGGLYWPRNYVSGKKYPLIVQTHDWWTVKFWMDGPWTTAFAAQALAGKGFFVAQIPDPDFNLIETPQEVPRAMAIYDGAIDYLIHRGLIDRDKFGIIGFSRTYWYVTYMLTHSKHAFAAAAIADGADGSYFQYIAFPAASSGYERVFGGPPYGKGMSHWLKQSPAFLMNQIHTSLRIQTLGPASVLSDWHWYTGLAELGKPVEMIYIPDGTHILEKPWDRMTSQQGNVDWFCFWIKGEEDSDPAKAEQYKRWRELRKLKGANQAEKHPN